jgi:hypothetical protein
MRKGARAEFLFVKKASMPQLSTSSSPEGKGPRPTPAGDRSPDRGGDGWPGRVARLELEGLAGE